VMTCRSFKKVNKLLMDCHGVPDLKIRGISNPSRQIMPKTISRRWL